MNREALSEKRPDAQDSKEILGRLDGVHANWFAAVVSQVDLRPPPRRRVLEHVQPPIVDEVHRRDRLVLERLAVIDFPERDEPLRIHIWKGAKHDAAKQTENAGGRTGPETQ